MGSICRRAVIVSMLVLAALFGAPNWASQPAAAATITVKVQHFNMCSYQCTGPNDPADLVILFGNQDRPDVITLNEACSDVYVRTRDYLAGLGYHPVRVITRSTTRPGCLSFGNAMFFAGVRVPNSYQAYPLSASSQPQVLGCELADTYAGRVAYCVGHTWRPEHIGEILYHVNGDYGFRHRFVGADLNREPDYIRYVYPAWYNGYNEVDPLERPTYIVPNPDRKIDYFFKVKAAYAGSEQPHCDLTRSDHCYVRGAFSFPV